MTKQIDALRKALSLLETLSVHASMSDEHRNEVSIVRLVLRDAITEGNRRAESDLLAALKKCLDLIESAEAHYATAQNTTSVRSGHEVGGYIKHYRIIPGLLHDASETARAAIARHS